MDAFAQRHVLVVTQIGIGFDLSVCLADLGFVINLAQVFL